MAVLRLTVAVTLKHPSIPWPAPSPCLFFHPERIFFTWKGKQVVSGVLVWYNPQALQEGTGPGHGNTHKPYLGSSVVALEELNLQPHLPMVYLDTWRDSSLSPSLSTDGGAMVTSSMSSCEEGGRRKSSPRAASGHQEPFAVPVPGSNSITQLVATPIGQQAVLTGHARGTSPRAVAWGRSCMEPSTAAPVLSLSSSIFALPDP